jgi:GH24 family phage-related lysozyme (muramidase)
MKPIRPTQVNPSTALHPLTQLPTALPAALPLPQPDSISLFTRIYDCMNCFTRWLTSEIAISEIAIERPPAISMSTVQLPIRTNQQGIEIIRQFEAYPADVEPDVRIAEAAVRRLVQVPLTSNQFSALVSFTFNVGETTFEQSALLKYLNAGRYRAAAREFRLWAYLGSQRFAKLAARRAAETALFLRPEAS